MRFTFTKCVLRNSTKEKKKIPQNKRKMNPDSRCSRKSLPKKCLFAL